MRQLRSSHFSRICCCSRLNPYLCWACGWGRTVQVSLHFTASCRPTWASYQKKTQMQECTTNHAQINRLSHPAEYVNMCSPPPDTVPTCTPTCAQADDATMLCVVDSESVFCAQLNRAEWCLWGFNDFSELVDVCCQISTSFTTGFTSALKRSLKQHTNQSPKGLTTFLLSGF